jgi:DNA-directed RNA polymerase I, II, and III subunit RPABC1
MLKDRGFTIPDEEQFFLEEYSDTMHERFLRQYPDITKLENHLTRDPLSRVYYKGTDTLYVHFINNSIGSKKSNVDIDSVKSFVDLISAVTFPESGKLLNSIVIHDADFTAQARTQFETITSEYHYQIFADSELAFNITKHFMMQKHVILSDEEKKELLLSIDRRLLPGISEQDPVMKYWGAKEGQIVKIYRKNIFPGNTSVAETLVYKQVKK